MRRIISEATSAAVLLGFFIIFLTWGAAVAG